MGTYSTWATFRVCSTLSSGRRFCSRFFRFTFCGFVNMAQMSACFRLNKTHWQVSRTFHRRTKAAEPDRSIDERLVESDKHKNILARGLIIRCLIWNWSKFGINQFNEYPLRFDLIVDHSININLTSHIEKSHHIEKSPRNLHPSFSSTDEMFNERYKCEECHQWHIAGQRLNDVQF